MEEFIKNKLGKKDKDLQAFAEKFLRNTDQSDLKKISEDELFEKVCEAFAFLRDWEGDGKSPKIEISYPRDQEQTPRTIVKLLNIDMPFLVDSITAEIGKAGLKIHEIYHPVLTLNRSKTGKFEKFEDNKKAKRKESLVYLQITHVEHGKPSEELEQNLLDTLSSVHLAVDDWAKMLLKATDTRKNLKHAARPYPKKEIAEARDFFEWLSDNNFTFLGIVDFELGKDGKLVLDKKSPLGVLREASPKKLKTLQDEISQLVETPELVEITKSNDKAEVHRNVHMDQIGVKLFDKSGKVIGERWFFGLFGSSAYYQHTGSIPVIRQKVRYVIEHGKFFPGGHSSKIAQFVLDSYPRDEIFQISAKQLFRNTIGVIELIKRPRVGLFVRPDRFGRFASLLIFVPKEKFDTSLRYKIQDIIEDELDVKVTEFYTQIGDSPLSRLLLIARPKDGELCKPDIKRLQRRIAEAANLWSDVLMGVLFSKLGEKRGEKLYARYENAFPASYSTTYNGNNAYHDILKIESAIEDKKYEVELYKEAQQAGTDRLRVKTYNPRGQQLPLSEILPVLENMGLLVHAERPFTITPGGHEGSVRLRDFEIEPVLDGEIKLGAVKEKFEVALQKTLFKELKNDSLNRLILFAGLDWRDVNLARALVKYMAQVGLPLGIRFVHDALVKNSEITTKALEMFYAYFCPKNKDAEKVEKLDQEINKLFQKVDSLNEDMVLRRFVDTIHAILRTNFFQKDKDGNDKTYVSFKFESAKVPQLPLPHPKYEIFVYARHVEGIHLRGGKVARGGLRWSDRKEDFRTEVLGLVKAQIVKNAVIVPVGSKGGFVVKRGIPPTREERMKRGIECYKTFLRGILDITDNIKSDKIVPPKDVVRRDDDDPYLVVAADKGTATFSDIANEVSAEYDYWLGDAFASGGSAGYDHKEMGITARGAWVSVQRHFREMGIDSQKDEFTVAGIGDMSGDVFGNGMLLSKTIKLVAAFNHMHIFIDPNPNAAESFKERKRVFEMGRSTWEDYNPKKISKGGGVYSRADKKIKLSKEAREALGITSSESLTPNDLISVILKAPVDLLWNGGIGTYVKAKSENNRDVGDRANDDLRVNGEDLRCKTVGEGGNLGLTQLGRIEYALAGGRVNSDAIDNSAGVDCSDHEVNIKIALAKTMEDGKLSLKKRNELLENMEEEVADLVLRDNYLQTQAITIAEAQGSELLEAQQSLMQALEAEGKLNRKVEFLPQDDEIKQRMADKTGLTRPELSVLLAYSKITLYEDILNSKVPDEDYFKSDLALYFPTAMREKYKKYLEDHKLRREIVGTFLTNSMVNRVGATFFRSIAKDTGVAYCDIARAYTIARDAFHLRGLWEGIQKLDGKVDADIQSEMLVKIGKFIEMMTYWVLRNIPSPIDVGGIVQEYGKKVDEFSVGLEKLLDSESAARFEKESEHLIESQVPKKLAQDIAKLSALVAMGDIIKVSGNSKLPLKTVGKVYYQIGEELSISWLRGKAQTIDADDYWGRLAVRNITNSLYEQQRRLAADVVATTCKGGNCDAAVATWIETNRKEIDRHFRFIKELRSNEKFDISMLVAAVRRMQALCAV